MMLGHTKKVLMATTGTVASCFVQQGAVEAAAPCE